MSEDDTIDPADGGKLIAAEYVLGVLGAEERREVERRLAQEPALASEVAFWEERLTGLADAVAPVSPPQATWSRIETAIGVAPRPPSVWQSLAFWRSFGIASATLAAASIAALAYIGLVPSTRAPLMATLGGSAGQPNFVAAVTASGNSLVIVPAALLTNDPRAFELWLIPAGETRPRSLGLIQPGQPIRLEIPSDLAGRVTPDATLAVSLEPPGGSPTGLPTGPVIAAGKLTNL
jgi:anti-sigma-K factor RskA